MNCKGEGLSEAVGAEKMCLLPVIAGGWHELLYVLPDLPRSRSLNARLRRGSDDIIASLIWTIFLRSLRPFLPEVPLEWVKV